MKDDIAEHEPLVTSSSGAANGRPWGRRTRQRKRPSGCGSSCSSTFLSGLASVPLAAVQAGGRR